MNDPKSSAQRQALARQRAQLIMQVRSGLLNVQEAARQLGISRKTYYKWERRALAAMLKALESQTRLEPGPALSPKLERLLARQALQQKGRMAKLEKRLVKLQEPKAPPAK